MVVIILRNVLPQFWRWFAIEYARRFYDVADMTLAHIWLVYNIQPYAIYLNADLDPAAVGIQPNTLDQDGILQRGPSSRVIGSLGTHGQSPLGACCFNVHP